MTAPEPLTLVELVQYLGERNYWLGYDSSGMYIAMPVEENSPAACGTGSTPWEAANEAMPERQVAPRDEAAELRAALEAVWSWLRSEFPAAPDSGDVVEEFAEQIWLTVCTALDATEEEQE